MTRLHPAATTPSALFDLPAPVAPAPTAPARDTSTLPALAYHRPQCFPVTCRCGAWTLEQLLPYRMVADPALIPNPQTEYLILTTGTTTYELHTLAGKPYALDWRWTGTNRMCRIPAPAGTALALPEHKCGRKPPNTWTQINIKPTPPPTEQADPPF